MDLYQNGVAVAADYTFTATPRGSTTPVPFVFQKHSYKRGKRDSKEFSVGATKLKQPMQIGAGSHELEALILTANAAAYRTALQSIYIIDEADMPDWQTANGPHFLEDFSIDDDVEGMSTLKVTISESMGAIGAAV